MQSIGMKIPFPFNAAVARVESAMAGGKPAEKETALRTGPHLTAQYLDEFFQTVEAERPSAEQQTRLRTVLDGLSQMPMIEVTKLIKDFASKERLDKLAETQKWEKARLESAYGVYRTRAKEMRQIYGAVRFAQLNAVELGWKKAYDTAREVLKQRAIDWQGIPLPTDEQKEKRKAARTERRIAQEVKETAQALANRGETVDYAAIAQQVRTAYAGKQSRRMAASLVLAHGPDVAELIAMSLPEMVNIHRSGSMDLLQQIADGDEPNGDEQDEHAQAIAGEVEQTPQAQQAA